MQGIRANSGVFGVIQRLGDAVAPAAAVRQIDFHPRCRVPVGGKVKAPLAIDRIVATAPLKAFIDVRTIRPGKHVVMTGRCNQVDIDELVSPLSGRYAGFQIDGHGIGRFIEADPVGIATIERIGDRATVNRVVTGKPSKEFVDQRTAASDGIVLAGALDHIDID